jgi:hypothetical protein
LEPRRALAPCLNVRPEAALIIITPLLVPHSLLPVGLLPPTLGVARGLQLPLPLGLLLA